MLLWLVLAVLAFRDARDQNAASPSRARPQDDP
jgi:hypothetical protein